MTQRLTLIAAATLALFASGAAATEQPPSLVRFTSCEDFLGYVKPLVGPIAKAPVPAVAVPAPGSTVTVPTPHASGTNVQEPGIDEPDVVKATRARLFALVGKRLFAVDIRNGRPRLAGSLRLDLGTKNQLLVDKTRVYVLSARVSEEFVPQTVLTEVDARDPSSMRVVARLVIDGFNVSTRVVGRTARLVLTTRIPHDLVFRTPTAWTPEALQEAAAANEAILAAAGPSHWLPQYTVETRTGTTSGSLLRCDQVSRPAAFSGLSMLTVLTLDLGEGVRPVDADGVVSESQTAYESAKALYVATVAQPAPWVVLPPSPAPIVVPSSPRPGGVRATVIHKFDTSRQNVTEYRAGGEVPGIVRDQWSLSEHRGILRAVSQGTGATSVTTMAERHGTLVRLASVHGLGEGEEIYAVRFVGDLGFVVTFRRTDPLYTLDLSQPARPRLRGQLELPGWSTYLHPLSGNLLLGIGQNADEFGRPFGTQLSVFDVADLGHPARLDRRTIASARSQVETDYHAFLYWPSTGIVVLPVTETRKGFVGAIVYQLKGGLLDEVARVGERPHLVRLGRLVQWSGGRRVPVSRSLVVRGTLYTVSEIGVRANDAATLADRGWAGFGRGPEPLRTASPD